MSKLITVLSLVFFAASASLPAFAASEAKARANADYKSAKAHCKTLKGDAQKACMKDAKAAHGKAAADARAAKP